MIRSAVRQPQEIMFSDSAASLMLGSWQEASDKGSWIEWHWGLEYGDGVSVPTCGAVWKEVCPSPENFYRKMACFGVIPSLRLLLKLIQSGGHTQVHKWLC